MGYTVFMSGNSISIHAPREGCDVHTSLAAIGQNPFQSTHPARGATTTCGEHKIITMHFNPRTPRGVRLRVISNTSLSINFNPRTPRGVRQRTSTRLSLSRTFQSTHPARGATVSRAAYENTPRRFQSTHPARGATAGLFSAFRGASDFNPRTPRGVRQDRRWQLADMRRISIHAPREGCDRHTK